MKHAGSGFTVVSILGSFVVLALVTLVSRPAEAGAKRIAVLDFDDTASASQTFSADNPMAAMMAMAGRMQQGQQQVQQGGIGASVASILTTELVKDGTYKVIERSQLQSILKEQDLSTSGVVDAKNAAKLGKVLGVSALITGTVTEYNVSTRTSGIMGIGKKTTIGKVALNARMIDTTSGEILFAADGSGEEYATGVAVGGYYNTDTTGSGNTLLGKATKKALENIMPQVIAHASKLKEGNVSGQVAYYDNAAKCCYLDLGKESGVEKDQTLYVTRVIREIKSPTTGEVIKRISEKVAELKIREVEKASSTAICIAGKCDDIKEKDLVSNVAN